MPDAVDEEFPFPAWSLRAGDAAPIDVAWNDGHGRDWAWGGADGSGVHVAIVDSGVDVAHPLVGTIDRAVATVTRDDGSIDVVDDTEGDACGHGTACASIIRRLAPGTRITSVRVLGNDFTGTGDGLIAGLQWAILQGVDVVNLSLSTTHPGFVNALRHLADVAYFRRTLIVASAHNDAKESFPWRFSSVLSVGSHEDTGDPERLLLNATPPVEVFAAGVDVPVAWPGGGTASFTGNSLATAHVSALAARVLAKRPGLTPPQVKTVLAMAADNIVPGALAA